MTTDEHAVRVVKQWLRAARSQDQLRQLWGSLTQYSKTLEGVAVENYKREKELTK